MDKFKGRVLAPHLTDSISTRISEPGTGVAIADMLFTPRRCRVTLSGFTIAVLAANGDGGVGGDATTAVTVEVQVQPPPDLAGADLAGVDVGWRIRKQRTQSCVAPSRHPEGDRHA